MGYIERAQVLTLLNDLVNDCTDKDEFYNRVFDAVDAMTAADVAPASKVARLEKLLDDKCDRCIAREKVNAARAIFEDIAEQIDNGACRVFRWEHGFKGYVKDDVDEFLSALKDKYTEGA